jgi:predicted dinucleotide-utilizing enzyme
MKLRNAIRTYGAKAGAGATVLLFSAGAFADSTLPDMTAQITAMGDAVKTQVTAQSAAVTPYVLFVVAVLLVFGIGKKLFKKIG